jgi:hypothetical protein
LTLLPDQLARLDAFIAGQDGNLTRAEGVRRVLDQALPPLLSMKKKGAIVRTHPAKPITKT